MHELQEQIAELSKGSDKPTARKKTLQMTFDEPTREEGSKERLQHAHDGMRKDPKRMSRKAALACLQTCLRLSTQASKRYTHAYTHAYANVYTYVYAHV